MTEKCDLMKMANEAHYPHWMYELQRVDYLVSQVERAKTKSQYVLNDEGEKHIFEARIVPVIENMMKSSQATKKASIDTKFNKETVCYFTPYCVDFGAVLYLFVVKESISESSEKIGPSVFVKMAV